MIFKNPYWTTTTKLDLLARWLIIHSIIYYELDNNVVSDSMFDNNAKQYVDMAWEATEEELKAMQYYYVMKGFDGSTGFDLYGKLKKADKQYLMQIAHYVLHQFGGKKGGKKK